MPGYIVIGSKYSALSIMLAILSLETDVTRNCVYK